jgi:hypothetical protein
MSQFVHKLFAGDTKALDTGPASRRYESTCSSERPASTDRNAHMQLTPLLSSAYLQVKRTVVAPCLLQTAPQTSLHIPYGASRCHPERHRCLQNARNHTKFRQYSCCSSTCQEDSEVRICLMHYYAVFWTQEQSQTVF